jgi:hypothetical protein
VKAHERKQMQKAIVRWRVSNQNMEFNMRAQAATRAFAYRKYVSSLFCGWRRVITWRKFLNTNIKLRTFKNLKAYVSYKKHMRRCATAVLRNREEQTKSNVIKAFWGLKNSGVEGKFQRSQANLFDGEKVKALEANKEIGRAEIIARFHDKRLACSIIERGLGKRLFAYFRKWQ